MLLYGLYTPLIGVLNGQRKFVVAGDPRRDRGHAAHAWA